MTELEQFVKEGSQMMVKLPAMRQLESKISAIKSWKERLANVVSLLSPNDSLVPVKLHCMCPLHVFNIRELIAWLCNRTRIPTLQHMAYSNTDCNLPVSHV